MSISDSQLPSLVLKGRYGLFKGNGTGEQADQLPITARKRAQSFDVAEDCRIRGLLDRIQHTYEYKLKGFKGNMRGTHIHGPFTTLHELLTTLPEDVALDIELSKFTT
jgi:glycerophosphodiester phosphodiesterase